ncbi:hypothetical protein C0991_002740 [Blastosporella zonata]|nr:hypothetical protein C0991_002740 [Blastosporella zonata]
MANDSRSGSRYPRHLATVPGSLHSRNGGPNIAEAFDQSLSNELRDNSPGSRTNPYSPTGEPSNPRLPPSLWMSPASTSVTSPAAYGTLNEQSSTPLPGSKPAPDRSPDDRSPVSTKSPILDSKTTLFTDIFSEELFPPPRSSLSPQATSPFTSPRISGSPDLQTSEIDPGQLAKEDPLATQVWKMYARTKATLPHAQRMENLTWRMMAMALKKKKEDEDEAAAKDHEGEKKSDSKRDASIQESAKSEQPHSAEVEASKTSDERGRRIDKGKARVRVVGFEGTNQDSFEEPDVVPMDWRAISRSRSRISMDWRPTSRSRSRPPEPMPFDQHGLLNMAPFDARYVFPNSHDSFRSDNTRGASKAGLSTSPSIPIPGGAGPSMLSLSYGRRSPPYTSHHPSELPSVFEDQAEAASSFPEARFLNPSAFNHPLSNLDSPIFVPSSLPSTGIHGLSKVPSAHHIQGLPNQQRSFPRHVRKTSFDHTVSKDGILAGLSGRHQVNGKPLSPENLVGQKRRAETPHSESMLRADPSVVNGVPPLLRPDQLEENGSPFPSSMFNFSFPPYEGLFSLPSATPSSPRLDFNPYRQQQQPHHHSSSMSSPTFASPDGTSQTPTKEGLSAAAVAASAVMAEGYASLSTANLGGVDDGLFDYGQLLGMVYPGLDGRYTHVDPAQLLAGQGDGSGGAGGSDILNSFAQFHASPSSDGWGNGVGSSADASPEPHNTSNASTPPSAEGAPQSSTARTANGRKYIPLKQELQRKASLSAANANSPTELRSSSSTPDNVGAEKGASDDGEQPPTLNRASGTPGGNSRKGSSLPKLASSSSRPRSHSGSLLSGVDRGSALSGTARGGAAATTTSGTIALKRQRRTSTGLQTET